MRLVSVNKGNPRVRSWLALIEDRPFEKKKLVSVNKMAGTGKTKMRFGSKR